MDNETMTATDTATDDTAPTATAQTIVARLPHDTAKALLLIAAKNDVRFYLNALALDTTGKRPVWVACDGHRLLVVAASIDQEEGYSLPRGVWIIPRAALASVKPLKNGRTTASLRVEITPAATGSMLPGRFTVTGQTTAADGCVDGRFPDWRRVIPKAEFSGVAGQFNPHYLSDFGTVAELLTNSKLPRVFICHNGPENCARVTLGIGDALGIIMPMRAESDAVDADLVAM